MLHYNFLPKFYKFTNILTLLPFAYRCIYPPNASKLHSIAVYANKMHPLPAKGEGAFKLLFFDGFRSLRALQAIAR